MQWILRVTVSKNMCDSKQTECGKERENSNLRYRKQGIPAWKRKCLYKKASYGKYFVETDEVRGWKSWEWFR